MNQGNVKKTIEQVWSYWNLVITTKRAPAYVEFTATCDAQLQEAHTCFCHYSLSPASYHFHVQLTCGKQHVFNSCSATAVVATAIACLSVCLRSHLLLPPRELKAAGPHVSRVRVREALDKLNKKKKHAEIATPRASRTASPPPPPRRPIDEAERASARLFAAGGQVWESGGGLGRS